MAKPERRGTRPAHGVPLATLATKPLSFVASKSSVDPALADLFASSLGPVRAPPKSRYTAEAKASKGALDIDDEDLGEVDDEASEPNSGSDPDSQSSVDTGTPEPILSNDLNSPIEKQNRKRKRKDQQEDLEDLYMRRLAEEEAKDERVRGAERGNKRQRTAVKNADGRQSKDGDTTMEDASSGDESMENGGPASAHGIPLHETLAATEEETGFEKSSRTVFLGNVSSLAITSKSDKKTLLSHLSSFLPSLTPDPSASHKVESLRFRSTAFSTAAIPKKAAFVRKELMDATTKSTNAYVVYSTALAAREAVRQLNGTVVLDRHLRVDGVAHPAKTDHRRCVFVGNLGFVDDESLMNAGDDGKKKRNKPPGDMEEGLWREFGKVGTVESVRVVRDPKTRVGKGFAYVQFTEPNAVEAALLYNDKKFPPMLPRKLRVTRAKHINKAASANKSTKPLFTATNPTRPSNRIYTPKPNPQTQSLYGRASKLLGRAGAAKLRVSTRDAAKEREKCANVAGASEMTVFEGYRAKAGANPTGMKPSGGSGKKKGGKDRVRRTARAAAWKSKGGKK
ncbi:MAG: Nucleolar protein 12 [Geoglossum umbratile]|nr:MAG: Nucleolar protein 12 [Geoglossum umbratile]